MKANLITQIDIAWAAGLFEGEGAIVIRPYNRRALKFRRPNGWIRHVRLSMTDQDIVDRFTAIVECGSITQPKRRHSKDGKPYKKTYLWVCSDWPNIERLLKLFLPFFGKRRKAKALKMLSHPARTPGGVIKMFCKRKHPLRGSKADVHIDSQGVIHCRKCQRVRTAQYRKEGRAYTQPEYFRQLRRKAS